MRREGFEGALPQAGPGSRSSQLPPCQHVPSWQAPQLPELGTGPGAQQTAPRAVLVLGLWTHHSRPRLGTRSPLLQLSLKTRKTVAPFPESQLPAACCVIQLLFHEHNSLGLTAVWAGLRIGGQGRLGLSVGQDQFLAICSQSHILGAPDWPRAPLWPAPGCVGDPFISRECGFSLSSGCTGALAVS